MASGYVPMPLRPGWVLERHLGWTVLDQRADMKLLVRRRGPFRQFLLLSSGSSNVAELSELLRCAGFVGWLSSLIWNDFGASEPEATRRLASCALEGVTSERWFGVGTFVIDLSLDEPTLLARMAARERGAVRRALALGAVGDFAAQPSRLQLGEFLDLYRPLALQRALELPTLATLERISAAGDLGLVRLQGPDGPALVINLIYRQGDSAWFFYGARDLAAPGWAGPAAQWATVRELKRSGARWYDLGLVASRDEQDGIFRFKSGLGGDYLGHGSEYRHVGTGVRWATKLRELGGRLTRARRPSGRR